MAALASVASAAPAHAAPSVDAVVVWAPGVDRAPVVVAAPLVARAIEAYDALALDDAWATLERARAEVDATGGGDLGPTALADLFMYRALVRTQRGDASGAWDEWSSAAVIAPERTPISNARARRWRRGRGSLSRSPTPSGASWCSTARPPRPPRRC